MKRNVFIRADGNAQIGLGHLIRCIALAQMLCKAFRIHFFCKEAPDKISKDILEHGFSFTKIIDESDFILSLSVDTIVVLDSYDLQTDYQLKIKKAGCKLVCIDDLHNKVFYADLIVNHSPCIEPKDYKAQPYTKFALGMKYALLRPAFLKHKREKFRTGGLNSLLICMGGSDYMNLTEAALNIAREFKFSHIAIITGLVYPHLDRIKQVLNEDNRITHYHAIDEDKIINLMAEADLAIVPASSILLELIAIKTSAITGYYIDNQQEFAYNVAKLGMAISCGNMLLNYEEKLRNILINLSVDDADQMLLMQNKIKLCGQKCYIKSFKAIYE